MKKPHLFFYYKRHPLIFGQASTATTNYKKNGEVPKHVRIFTTRATNFCRRKVDFFASKILIWEFFSISEAPYKTYSVDELFSRYYSELYEKYYSSSKM